MQACSAITNPHTEIVMSEMTSRYVEEGSIPTGWKFKSIRGTCTGLCPGTAAALRVLGCMSPGHVGDMMVNHVHKRKFRPAD